MLLLRVDSTHPDPGVIARAAAVLASGGLVAFPTETVYGLGAHALDPEAVARIFDAKGRPSHNPVIVHVADADAARELVREWPPAAARLAARFWPGPLTLVLPRRDVVPPIVSAGLDSVAVRLPAHPVALALLRASRIPVAAPSANRSSRVSPTTAAHVVASLGHRVDIVLDAGASAVGIESTVVDLTGASPVILRPGIIDAAAIAEALGRTVRHHRGTERDARRAAEASPRAPNAPGAPLRSPGMLDRHYAPAAEVRLFDADDLRDEHTSLGAELQRAANTGRRIAALVRTAAIPSVAHTVRMPLSPADYARALYATLHAMDAAGFDLLLIERPPDAPEWRAIHDRLTRAAR